MSLPAPIIRTWYGLDWVLIDDIWWSIQNYSPTKLDDDTDIPEVTDNAAWTALTTPAWCWYNNTDDEEFQTKYGRLYNWYAVSAGLKMPCGGCFVPSSAQWEAMRDCLIANGYNWDETTGEDRTGKSLASSGGEWTTSATVGHVGNDQSSNNSTGLGLLPGGRRSDSNGTFALVGTYGLYWSSNDITSSNGGRVFLRNTHDYLAIDNAHKRTGNAVRIARTAYTVVFDSQGGSAIDAIVTAEGELITVPTAPIKSGYVFGGWYKEAGLVNEWDFDTDAVTDDITLYAKWVSVEPGDGKKRKYSFGYGYKY